MSGASYVGKAPLTLVKTASSVAYVYAGQPVPASADPGDVARLVAEGYLVEAEQTEATSPAPVESSDEKPLSKMTKAELEAVATAEGVDLSDASNNDKRVAAIEAARAAKATAPATDGKPLGEMSVDELKEFAAEHELDVAGVADGDLLIHIEKALDDAETADNATASNASGTSGNPAH